MATLIMNIGRVPLQVGLIETATGKKTSTRVMGRGRGEVPAGYTIDPNWMALNGKNIKLVDTKTIIAAKPVAVKTMSSNKGKLLAAAKAATTAKAPAVTTAPTVATKGA